MVVATLPSKGIRSRKRKRETEEASPSADAVSEKNLKKKAPMILARGKTAAYRSSSAPRRLAEELRETEASTTPGTEEAFKPQKANVKRGSTIGQTWEVDIRKECFRRNTGPLESKLPATLSRKMRRETTLGLRR